MFPNNGHPAPVDTHKEGDLKVLDFLVTLYQAGKQTWFCDHQVSSLKIGPTPSYNGT